MADVALSGAPLFLYGTLRHLPLLETVLGRAVDLPCLRAVHLPDASVTWVAGQPFPMIRLGAGMGADGIVLDGASAEDLARLDFYEGGFGYALAPVRLADGSAARVYVPGPQVGPPGAAFDLADWAADWGALSVEAAREAMSYFGAVPAHEIARRFAAIRLRAAARLRAQAGTRARGTLRGRVDIHAKTTPYSDFFKLDDYHLSAQTFEPGGAMSAPMRRAVFVAMDAALVLPYDPVRDRVLVVEQFRMGPFGRGDPDAWQLEPVAGHVDPGERPEDAARREAREEAGLSLGTLHPVAEAYPSPGASTEFFYLYIGLADLPDDITGIGGMAEEGENIRSHLLEFDALMAMLDARRAANLPLILAGYWLARHRDALRAAR